MGLLDSVISTIRGGPSPSAPEQALLLPVVIEFVNGYPGGLQGLIQKFQREGLAEVVSSWLGSGPNQPVSPAQLQSVLSDDEVEHLAKTSGQAPDVLLGNLSKLLPTLVDHVTPDGQLGQNQELDVDLLMGSVSGVLRKL
ncbi:YidB family protein [Eoetvoesiella caeni]